ncbi:MAG: hypothetical protein K0S27_970 [Gammaproteobacteria bacterium]|nr:hypothetical protein [Gammaproteobacteria bacterium]
MSRLSTIELFRESLKFSAGHFTIFSSMDRENIHGHDYTLHVSLTTLIEDEGLSFDYRFYERQLYALCGELDKAILIAGLCKYLKISEEGDYCCIHFNSERIMLLKRDVKILPIRNVTVEELSNWFLEKLLLERKQLANHRIQKIEVKVVAGRGRSGSARWEKR